MPLPRLKNKRTEEETMKKLIAGMLLLFFVQLAVMSGMVQASSEKAANCSTYASNQAKSEGSTGGGAIRGGLRGAAGGAVFGGIIGGRRGARRGARLSGALGLVGGGIRASENRKASYQHYYETCMQGGN
jgi:hypothetical protein